MNEEIDDQDFYQDFTTPTDWELFIAHLEKVIHEWKLPKVKKGPSLKVGDLSEGEWKRTSEKILFSGMNSMILFVCLFDISFWDWDLCL